MKKYLKQNTPLKIFEYDNGIILPQKKAVKEYPMWGLGGVCDNNNMFLDASFYDGGWATHGGKYEWEKEYYVDEYAVYIGLFFSHWGHFLIDLSGRLWALNKLCQEHPNIKVAYLGDEKPSGNYLRFFELLGVNSSQLLCIKEPTRFKKVFLPELSFKSCDWYSNEFVQMFDQIIAQVEKNQNAFHRYARSKKVYFSRKNFRKAALDEFGEEYFEQVFNDNGFESVSPESLSLDEQIYIWNHSESISCINGSIILNVIFSNNTNLELTVLNKTSIFHENPYILLQARRLQAEFVDVYCEPFRRYPKSLGKGPYWLKNNDEFRKYCNNQGFQQKNGTNVILLNFKNSIRYLWAILEFKNRLKRLILLLTPKSIQSFRRKKKYNIE